MKKITNISFICLILLVMVGGLLKTIFFPIEINRYENRYAEKIKAPTTTAVLDQSFQNSLDNALADQIPYAQNIKKFYNDTTTNYLNSLLKPVLSNKPNGYIPYKDLYIYGGDQLVHKPNELERFKPKLTARAQDINAAQARNPQTEFYCYYIEKDDEVDFDTNQKAGARAFLFNLLKLPAERCGYFAIDNYQTYREYFYKTDHHWNNKGSYAAYKELLSLLKIDQDPLKPQGEETIGTFIGANGVSTGTDIFQDTLTAYRFNLPKMTYIAHGNEVVDYGHASVYLDNGMEEPSYGGYFGGDLGELIIQTGNEERKNILILGDSFDNAIITLLATHYHNTHAVDLRYYEHYMGKQFDLDAYLQENEIDQVLLIGSPAYFYLEDFNLGG